MPRAINDHHFQGFPCPQYFFQTSLYQCTLVDKLEFQRNVALLSGQARELVVSLSLLFGRGAPYRVHYYSLHHLESQCAMVWSRSTHCRLS
jgi:hypothetical protein